LWYVRIEGKKNVSGAKNNDDKVSSEYNIANLPWLKRFSVVLVASSVAIIVSASSSIILQVIELSSSNNTISTYFFVFKSILHGSAGITWLAQTITAVVIIGCSLGYYYLSKRQNFAEDNITEKGITEQRQQNNDNRIH
jgi:hypothetical protein